MFKRLKTSGFSYNKTKLKVFFVSGICNPMQDSASWWLYLKQHISVSSVFWGQIYRFIFVAVILSFLPRLHWVSPRVGFREQIACTMGLQGCKPFYFSPGKFTAEALVPSCGGQIERHHTKMFFLLKNRANLHVLHRRCKAVKYYFKRHVLREVCDFVTGKYFPPSRLMLFFLR